MTNEIEPNLKVNVNPSAADGDYFITLTWKFRDIVVDRNILTFKIGKGRRLLQDGGWNIGYSSDQSPTLNETEKAEAAAIAIYESYLKDKKYDIIEIKSEFHELGNFSGFFPVVRIDVGEPQSIGEIVSYIIDLEEKKVMNRTATHRGPAEYFTGEAFDEVRGNFIRKWDAKNFIGFWHDPSTNISTETLVIDQDLLNSSHRVIEKHNLIYTTSPVLLKYNVYANANITPSSTEGYYPAIGWMGEKYVCLPEDRLARIIFEQNASEVKTMVTGETWKFREGYKIYMNSIDALVPERQGWFSLFKDDNIIENIIFSHTYTYTYPGDANYSIPILVTYISNMRSLPDSDAVDFKYTWLRSWDIAQIKEGDIFGAMEVISVDNGRIELRNKESIDLSPGNVINLMGNISMDRRNIGIQVDRSNEYLSFHPFKLKRP